MNILINDRYGGEGELSYKAMIAYAKALGKTIYCYYKTERYVNGSKKRVSVYDEYHGQAGDAMTKAERKIEMDLLYFSRPLTNREKIANGRVNKSWRKDQYASSIAAHKIFEDRPMLAREDPVLIKVVSDLKAESHAMMSHFRLITVDDNCKYLVMPYDGKEVVLTSKSEIDQITYDPDDDSIYSW